MKPIISADGNKIVFLNADTRSGTWRYNIAVAGRDGHVDAIYPLHGISYSSGAFVGDALFFRELFSDRDRIYRVDLKSRKVSHLELKHSPDEIATFERITLSVEKQRAHAADMY
jgi:hypothetical protein